MKDHKKKKIEEKKERNKIQSQKEKIIMIIFMNLKRNCIKLKRNKQFQERMKMRKKSKDKIVKRM